MNVIRFVILNVELTMIAIFFVGVVKTKKLLMSGNNGVFVHLYRVFVTSVAYWSGMVFMTFIHLLDMNDTIYQLMSLIVILFSMGGTLYHLIRLLIALNVEAIKKSQSQEGKRIE